MSSQIFNSNSVKASQLCIERKDLRSIRHALSASLAFLDTSVTNLSGDKPDRERALRLHATGIDKIRAAIQSLDQITDVPMDSEVSRSIAAKEILARVET